MFCDANIDCLRSCTRSSTVYPETAPTQRMAHDSCDRCLTKFKRFINKAQRCTDCQVQFCKHCLSKVDGQSKCRRCIVISVRPLQSNVLMELPVKDLRFFLMSWQVPMSMCKEKRDLVDLIIQHVEQQTEVYMRSSNPSLASSQECGGRVEMPATIHTHIQDDGIRVRPCSNSSVMCSVHDEPNTDYVHSLSDDGIRVRPINSPCSNTSAAIPMPYHPTPVHVSETEHDSHGNAHSSEASSHRSDISSQNDNASIAAELVREDVATSQPCEMEDVGSDVEEDEHFILHQEAPTSAHSLASNTEDDVSPIVNVHPTNQPTNSDITDKEATSSLGKDGQVSQHITLDNIKSASDLDHLTPRQLKEILVINRVDYRGCVERKELQGRVLRLWLDYTISKSVSNLPDEVLCKVCMDAQINCVLLECGHMVTCIDCGKRLNECPICRQYIIRAVRTFRS